MTTAPCKSIGCTLWVESHKDFCTACSQASLLPEQPDTQSDTPIDVAGQIPLVHRYPEEYRSVVDLGSIAQIDPFAVLQLFNIQDPSGCIQHASRKLLLSGNASDTVYRDILEARDTLTRWLQLNQGLQ